MFNYSSAHMPAVVGGERYVDTWNPNSTRVRCCFQGERSVGRIPGVPVAWNKATGQFEEKAVKRLRKPVGGTHWVR
jgi:hypothetical protein